MRWVPVLLGLAACGSRAGVSAETPPRPEVVTIQLTTEVPVAADSQLVLAYRDGDAAWQRIDPHGDLSFSIVTGRYSLLIACPYTSHKVLLRHLTVEDDRPKPIDPCQPSPLGSIRGRVEGRGGADAIAAARTPDELDRGRYHVLGLEPASDLVVMIGEGEIGRWHTSRLTIVRDVPVQSSRMPELAVLDLEETGVDAEHRTFEMTGVEADERVRLVVTLTTANQSRAMLTVDKEAPYVADLAPANLLAAGDEVTITAIASSGLGQRKGRLEGDTFSFPPPLAAGSAELVSTSPRLRFAWSAHEGTKLYELRAKQFPECEDCDSRSWIASVSPRYLATGPTLAYEMEDLRDISGWITLDPATEIQWEIVAWDADDRSVSRRGSVSP